MTTEDIDLPVFDCSSDLSALPRPMSEAQASSLRFDEDLDGILSFGDQFEPLSGFGDA